MGSVFWGQPVTYRECSRHILPPADEVCIPASAFMCRGWRGFNMVSIYKFISG